MKGSKKLSLVQFSLDFLQFCLTKPSQSLLGLWRMFQSITRVQHLDLDLHMGLWRMLKVPDCRFASCLDLDLYIVIGVRYTHAQNLGSLS